MTRTRRAAFLAPLFERPGREWALGNTRSGLLLARRVEPAVTRSARRRGLLGRSGLPPGSAMVLAPCSSIHTCFMQFPLDVVFVSAEGLVLKVRTAMPPWRFSGAFGAFATIEGPVGLVEASSVRPGDRLALVPAADGTQRDWSNR